MKLTFLPIAVASALLMLAGCETAHKDEGALVQARSAVAQAEADPNVAKYAATELDRARKLLINAESAARDKGANHETTAHYAYLATQVARIAEQRAHEQVAVERIKAGEVDRQKILLSARENESPFEDLQVARTERGIVLTLEDVLFDKARTELKPGAQRSLDQITAFLNENPERRVQVEGFTDSEGSADFNIELAQTRADAVAMAILRRGIDAERVRALGYGEEFPVASNANPSSRQLNRRVEIIVSNDEQAIPGRAAAGSP